MNASDSLPSRCYPGIVVLPGVFTVSGIIVMCLNLCVFIAMTLSRSITERIRLPLMILCVSDFFYGTQIILVTIPEIDTSYTFCYCVRFVLTLFVSISSTVVFLLSVDRCICLYFETSYMGFVSTKRVRATYVTVWIIVPILTYIRIGPLDTTNTTFRTVTRSHKEAVFIFAEIIVRILTLCFSIGTVLKIRVIQNRMSVATGEFRNTLKVLFFVCLYQIMFLPSNIHKLVWVTRHDMYSLETFRQLSSIIMASTGLINPLLYTLRFTDCRLSMLLMCCWWNRALFRRIEYRKKQLLAPFLDVPNFVGVLELTNAHGLQGNDISRQLQRVSTIDISPDSTASAAPVFVTVQPAADTSVINH